MAHRLMFALKKGELIPGLEIMHTCDNPSCVRPRHLKQGTHLENIKQCVDRGRQNQARGESSWNSVLTDDLVREIRSRYIPGKSGPKSSQITGTRRLAKAMGLTRCTVRHVVIGKTWRHVK